jgi:hypothetical protein
MQKFKKQIAFFLLLVFSWVLLPASLAHEVFADHTDTDCHTDHLRSGAQIESIHTHCDIFKTTTPIYETPELIVFTISQLILLNEVNQKNNNSYFHLTQTSLPARAPPVS